MPHTDDPLNRFLENDRSLPPIGTLLSRRIGDVDIVAGTLQMSYEGVDAFRNPAGNVAGGMLGAMLDDLTAHAVHTIAARGKGVVTVSLNVYFLRPASTGPFEGSAALVRRGRELCHVNGMLRQQGKDIAWAVAICKLVPRELLGSIIPARPVG